MTFDIAWQRGDVALVDNFVTMHGRRTFSGTRKVLPNAESSRYNPIPKCGIQT